MKLIDITRFGADRAGGHTYDPRMKRAVTAPPGQWGRPIFPDDPAKTKTEHARIDAHNTRVAEILRAKGFK